MNAKTATETYEQRQAREADASKAWMIKQKKASDKAEALVASGRVLMEAVKPAWAVAAIIAEEHRDTSDAMSDYHGSATERTVFLAWSKHERDLFPEMRRAAQKFPETAHMGPGKDIYTAHVVFTCRVPSKSGGLEHSEGACSPWHWDLYGQITSPYRNEGVNFQTHSEADAFVRAAPKPEDITCYGFRATFGWKIDKESVEHREKWSMGHGYYLAGLGGKYSCWQVRKVGIKHYSDIVAACFGRGDVA